MLCNIVVENYALISHLEIDFKKGLTIITGETGAGKSILLGALSLILGKRADTSVLLNKDRKCLVEGTFDITSYGLRDFFNEKGIDYENQSIIRREIAVTGKSRAFINDTPVNLELLTELGNKLIDIHSQHQNLNLSDSVFQMKVIDSYAKNQDLLDSYKLQYLVYKNLQKQYRQMTDEADQAKSELDYLQFQLTQLLDAQLREGEQEELESELEELAHAEEIKTGLSTASSLLQGNEQSVLQQLKDCAVALNRIQKFLREKENLAARIETAYIEIKDLAAATEMLNNQLTHDPARMGQVSERLNLLYTLEKKHRVNTLSELIALRDHLKTKVDEINSYDFNLGEVEKKMKEAETALTDLSDKLNRQREKALKPFEDKITGLLHEVGIPNAGFTIRLEKTNDFNPFGSDKIQFLFSANRNMNLQDIARVASGGEISRLMLCIKSLMSDSSGMPTIIFDEIDTGVSGEIAERVGNIINRMADRMQIINITHLPQVASKGKNHFLVYKSDEDNTTVTRMKLLSPKERHLEIAKMLSGEEVTHAALENARALLGN
ncbi:MAG: DNA repair protein RecN [Bacteroidales bacterium]|nr:DNA repair protein RecN [Bacteroidales bacterium]